jgi:type 1 glutamine amidotransferase
MAENLMVAVITGRHGYDVPNFHRLFRGMRGVDAYIQNLEDFVTADAGTRSQYDVLVFYNFHQATPTGEEQGWEKGVKAALEQMGQTAQGIVVLHHALLAYRQWPLWSEVVGIAERGFGYYHDQTLRVEIADRAHPITQGLQAWEMMDETYSVNEPGEGNHILLTTEHPQSMRALAWTRTYGQARVFCYESGHDNQTWADANFRTVLARGTLWVAGRL